MQPEAAPTGQSWEVLTQAGAELSVPLPVRERCLATRDRIERLLARNGELGGGDIPRAVRSDRHPRPASGATTGAFDVGDGSMSTRTPFPSLLLAGSRAVGRLVWRAAIGSPEPRLSTGKSYSQRKVLTSLSFIDSGAELLCAINGL
jgi:hypothetical protein